jgi:hypothetical protein
MRKVWIVALAVCFVLGSLIRYNVIPDILEAKTHKVALADLGWAETFLSHTFGVDRDFGNIEVTVSKIDPFIFRTELPLDKDRTISILYDSRTYRMSGYIKHHLSFDGGDFCFFYRLGKNVEYPGESYASC